VNRGVRSLNAAFAGRRRLIVIVVVVLLAAAGGAAIIARSSTVGGFGLGPADDEVADLRYVIPAGAGQRQAAGESLDLLPPALEVEVGDVIEIVNDDDQGHLVGPFFVAAGETLRQRFASPGVFQGVCSVHSSGQIVITVR
jgi:hypothetical protein